MGPQNIKLSDVKKNGVEGLRFIIELPTTHWYIMRAKSLHNIIMTTFATNNIGHGVLEITMNYESQLDYSQMASQSCMEAHKK